MEKGLSVGVHIWEPLAHSCPLSACLRMDLDGTGQGRRGQAGGSHRRTEIQTGARDSPAQRAGRGLGSAARCCWAPFPCAGSRG